MTMYAKYFFGFDPANSPGITFTREGDRDSLLRDRSPGDVIVFVGTQGEDTAEHERGKLLGAAEIGNKSVRTEDLMDVSTQLASNFKDGQYRWPSAIPMLRAWKFDPQPLARDVFSSTLNPGAQVRAIVLSEEDETAVHTLNWVEVTIPNTEERDQQTLRDIAAGRGPTTPGPIAGSGSHTVTRGSTGPSWTYVMRFGDSNIWKVGCSSDVRSRANAINAHIPVELLEVEWKVEMTQKWPNAQFAQDISEVNNGPKRFHQYRTVS